MKLRMFDMIDRFVEEEVRNVSRRTETRLRGVLERFALHVDEQRGGRWTLSELTEEDGRSFYRTMKQEDHPGKAAWQAVMDLDAFMRYAVSKRWIDRRPWGKLASDKTTTAPKAAGPASKKERERVRRYCAAMRCADFAGIRDRAILPLVFTHHIGSTELSKLDLADYDGRAVRVISPFAWRCRTITLSDDERWYLDEYLAMRKGRAAVGHEEALFLGEKGRRIGPRTVTELRTIYRQKMEEQDEE